MDDVTPQKLFDYYWRLTYEQKIEFIKLLAKISTPDVVLILADGLSKPEKFEFAGQYTQHIIDGLMPVVIEQAWNILKQKPKIEKDKFVEDAKVKVKEWVEEISREVAEVEREKLKEKRDRQSDSENVVRYVEIINFAQSNPKIKQNALAKKFDLSPSMIRKILKEETKWRTLFKKTAPTS